MLLRPFLPGGDRRVRETIQRILKMSPSEVDGGLHDVMRRLSHKHAGIEAVFSNRYRQLAHLVPPATEPSPRQSLLIGAYFSTNTACNRRRCSTPRSSRTRIRRVSLPVRFASS